MSNRIKQAAAAALLAITFAGTAPALPAQAQAVPPGPGVGAAIGGCAVLAGLSPCLGAVIPASPIVVLPGFGGTRNVDVDKDVDRSRTPGRVVIVQ